MFRLQFIDQSVLIMELELICIFGFILASYSVVGNDVIQTLGTFISSNHQRRWWILWLYSSLILGATLFAGWYFFDGDVTFGRLDKIPLPEQLHWWLLIPPIALMIITQIGFPVSTTFIILSVFSSSQVIEKMLIKSVAGYVIAFLFALIVYLLIARKIEAKSAAEFYTISPEPCPDIRPARPGFQAKGRKSAGCGETEIQHGKYPVCNNNRSMLWPGPFHFYSGQLHTHEHYLDLCRDTRRERICNKLPDQA